ncbi:hypothetical protein VTK56DRAFT_8821 [Thermocarpiscus australiensis]
MAQTAAQPPDRPGRPGRRRPFSALMKKLASLKAASSGDGGRHAGSKRGGTKKRQEQNNPYPLSGHIRSGASPNHSQYSVSSGPSRRAASVPCLERNESGRLSSDEQPPPTTGGRSMAPTVSTERETLRSMTNGASSLAGTSRTANGRRGGDSTFSSPAHSVHSLTTTLTTIQTVPPNAGGNQNTTNASHSGHHSHQSSSQVIHFNQPFPSSAPASAIPAHLAPTVHPTTYATATANNLLTDNASILTLASSSKRRRRRSLDTDASVRALAPSSLWGGSRESLPLSVLSATMDGAGGGPTTPGLHRGGSVVANERTSIYSATGILASERNSFYTKQGLSGVAGDGASVRSGLLGHGRADSVSGSIGGLAATSPLTSPREAPVAEREEASSAAEREVDSCPGERDEEDGGS